MRSAGKPRAPTLGFAGSALGVGHVFSISWLRRKSRRRIQRLTEALPDALDLMVVCLESGLGLNATIARVGEERAALNDPLGNEFEQVSFELRSGREGHPSYRAVAHAMWDAINDVHPSVAAAMKFVDRQTEPRLERLSAEIRNAARAASTGP